MYFQSEVLKHFLSLIMGWLKWFKFTECQRLWWIGSYQFDVDSFIFPKARMNRISYFRHLVTRFLLSHPHYAAIWPRDQPGLGLELSVFHVGLSLTFWSRLHYQFTIALFGVTFCTYVDNFKYQYPDGFWLFLAQDCCLNASRLIWSHWKMQAERQRGEKQNRCVNFW